VAVAIVERMKPASFHADFLLRIPLVGLPGLLLRLAR
jgi:hypothetical protein